MADVSPPFRCNQLPGKSVPVLKGRVYGGERSSPPVAQYQRIPARTIDRVDHYVARLNLPHLDAVRDALERTRLHVLFEGEHGRHPQRVNQTFPAQAHGCDTERRALVLARHCFYARFNCGNAELHGIALSQNGSEIGRPELYDLAVNFSFVSEKPVLVLSNRKYEPVTVNAAAKSASCGVEHYGSASMNGRMNFTPGRWQCEGTCPALNGNVYELLLSSAAVRLRSIGQRPDRDYLRCLKSGSAGAKWRELHVYGPSSVDRHGQQSPLGRAAPPDAGRVRVPRYRQRQGMKRLRCLFCRHFNCQIYSVLSLRPTGEPHKCKELKLPAWRSPQ